MTIVTGLSRRTLARNGWRLDHIIAAVALTAAGFALTWQAWADLARIALKDEEASHILLVPVIVAWLVWRLVGDVASRRRIGGPRAALNAVLRVLATAAAVYLVITIPLIRVVDHMRARGLRRQNTLVLM